LKARSAKTDAALPVIIPSILKLEREFFS